MARLYRTERHKLDSRELPRSGKAIFVHQNAFAYSKKGSPSKKRRKKSGPAHLFTTAGTCHALCLSERGTNVFAHVDPALDALTAIYHAMSHLVKNGVITTPSLDDVKILKSRISASVDRSYLTLLLLGCKPRVMYGLPLLGFAGYLSSGELVRFNKNSLQVRSDSFKSYKRNTEIKNEALKGRTFYCSNDGKFHNNGSFNVLPGVPAFHMDMGTNGTPGLYSFNIPIDFDFYPFIVPLASGVELTMNESAHGDYVTIKAQEPSGPLSPLTIKRVQKALFAVAKQIAVSHEKKARE